jgi:2-polyprenyl-3-methyl-5-hydroxy-6-metoxy-1,4-benzoquinol methylase
MTENYNKYIEQSKEYYDKRFGHDIEDAFRLNFDETERWNHIKCAVEKFTGNRKSEIQILDFGCGRGWLSQRLSTFGNVTGVDLSDEAIHKAKQNFPDINFICIDAAADLHQSLGNKKFDLVVSSEVIEHVKKQQEYVDNMVSLLSDRGKIIMTTPNGQWKEHHFFKERKTWAQPFEFWLTRDNLMKLTEGKLKNVSISTFDSKWIFDYRSFGLPEFIGNRFFRMFLSLIDRKQNYLEYLEKKGYGLYLLMEGFK